MVWTRKDFAGKAEGFDKGHFNGEIYRALTLFIIMSMWFNIHISTFCFFVLMPACFIIKVGWSLTLLRKDMRELKSMINFDDIPGAPVAQFTVNSKGEICLYRDYSFLRQVLAPFVYINAGWVETIKKPQKVMEKARGYVPILSPSVVSSPAALAPGAAGAALSLGLAPIFLSGGLAEFLHSGLVHAPPHLGLLECPLFFAGVFLLGDMLAA